jgi:hypothetical protein
MDNKMYIVKNRSASRVGYRIPEDGIRREFAVGEQKRISFTELEKLSYQAGGRELMTNFLQIQSEEAIQELGIPAEPEYNMNEEQIVELIKNGSLDAFLDCLDFAPTGVIDLLKTYAVSVPLTDYEKRNALKEKTGFDIDSALRNLEAQKREEEAGSKSADGASGRRIQPVVEEAPVAANPARRTSGSGYKVINKNVEAN